MLVYLLEGTTSIESFASFTLLPSSALASDTEATDWVWVISSKLAAGVGDTVSPCRVTVEPHVSWPSRTVIMSRQRRGRE